jgi:hypothetical protein
MFYFIALLTRQRMFSICFKLPNKVSLTLIANILYKGSNQKLMQLLLDCSVIPEVIASSQSHGEQVLSDLFYFSRTWCFSVHRERMKRLGKWNFR